MSCLRIIIIFFTLFTYFLVEPADLNYMNTTIREYLSDTRHHDSNYSRYKERTKKHIHDEFVRFALKTYNDTFRVPSLSSTVNFTTVIGILKGTKFGTKDDVILGVGAHYDTVNTTKGVDENGSGVAALLEVTRQITDMNKQGTKRGNTIIFVSFDLEEENQFGSKYFLQNWLPRWLHANYGSNSSMLATHGIIILDTLMEYSTKNNSQRFPEEIDVNASFPDTYKSIKSDYFRGDFLTLIYRKPTDDLKLANAFKRAWSNSGRLKYEIEEFALPIRNVSNLTNAQMYSDFFESDQYSFWEKMVPAIQLTDTGNFRGNMKRCYQQQCDNLETLLTDNNIKFLGKTADATAMTVHNLSEPTSDPTTTPGDSSGGQSLGISITTTIIAAVVVWLRNQIAFA